jgi:hypothetical protein
LAIHVFTDQHSKNGSAAAAEVAGFTVEVLNVLRGELDSDGAASFGHRPGGHGMEMV